MYRNRKYRGRGSSNQSGVLRESQNIQTDVASNPVPPKIQKSNDDNVFEIPSSQPPTQRRYLSQRSLLASKSQSILQFGQRLPTTYYEKVLVQCGIELNTDDYFLIKTDHLNFASSLRKTLKEDKQIKDFLESLFEALNSNVTLTKLLSGCKVRLPDSDVINQSQQSLMKIFLLIDILQEGILNALLDIIKRLASDKNSLNSEFSYVELILSHLKFIDHIKYGEVVCKKLLEVLEVSTISAQQEIIRSLEDLVDPTRHNEVIVHLMKLYPDDKDLLVKTTVETFGNMCLSVENQSVIRNKILLFMKAGAPKMLLPAFIKFLFNSCTEEMSSMPQIIESIRNCLSWDNLLKEDDITNQKDIFDCITRSLIRSRKFFDVWLKCIQTFDDPRSVDFLILLIMISINDERSKYLENIIRRKIKMEQFNSKLIDNLAKQYFIVFANYVNIFLELVDKFFRDKNNLISLFATNSYIIVFGMDACDKKLLLSRIVGFICETHPHTSGSDLDKHPINPTNDVNTMALFLLSAIVKKYANEINQNMNNISKLLRIFEMSNELTLMQFRLAMDIICTLAYPVDGTDEHTSIQNDIDITVKKQVASSISSVQSIGIIGIVRIIDHTIWNQFENLKLEAEKYNDLIIASTCNSPKSLALFYDELSLVVSPRNKHNDGRSNFNESFLDWLLDIITDNFQTNFVLDALPANEYNGFSIENKYCINTQEEQNSENDSEINTISINIAGCVLKPTSSAFSSAIVLAPLFNLMRNLHFRKENGNLENINAVLGCSIMLPKLIGDSHEFHIFEDYPENQAKQILDIYFYTANWMREIISGFVSQQDSLIESKVLSRLSDLIQLEEKIRIILLKAPIDYYPPDYPLNTNASHAAKVKKPNIGAKNKKQMNAGIATVVDTENMTICTGTENPSGGSNTNKINIFAYGPKEIYRQIDPDIMLLLQKNFIISTQLPADEIGKTLGLIELKFVLEDLAVKVESIFGVRKFLNNQSWQVVTYSTDFINDLVHFLPKIMKSLKQLIEHIRTIFIQVDKDFEQPDLYTNEVNYCKMCISLCFRLMSALFTWPEFETDNNRELLKSTLIAILDEPNDENHSKSINSLAIESIQKLFEFRDNIFDIRSAVYMYHLVKSLYNFCKEKTAAISLPNLCKLYLTKTWYNFDGNRDGGSQCNILLDELLKGLLNDITLNGIKPYLGWISTEIIGLNKKNVNLKTFPSFNRTNFPLLYRSLCVALITSLTKKVESSGSMIAHLITWEKACNLLDSFLHIVKYMEMPKIFAIFLKHAHIFLKIFLQHGIPMLEYTLRNQYDRVNQLLKVLQNTTRYLHKICCHSKAAKNTTIINQIPFIRETVESLLFKVKAVLAVNNCSEAFWMGNLRNKDIHGEQVESSIDIGMNGSTNEEESVREDDDSLDEEITDQILVSSTIEDDSPVAGPSRMSSSRVF